VGPELSASPRTTACPSCGASLRPDAAFCGQCYADFRPPAVVARVADISTAVYVAPAPDPLTAPLSSVLSGSAPVEDAVEAAGAVPGTAAAEVTWPCLSCGVANPLSAGSCSACGSGFLAAARGEIHLVLPLFGDITAMSRGRRLGVAGAVVAAVLVPLALLTLVLTKHPPADKGPSTPAPVTEVTGTP
jgi:ribosomal protein L40E